MAGRRRHDVLRRHLRLHGAFGAARPRGRIGTEELVETLSRVFGGMLEVADSHGGQLLKFGGDALLFLFDGPDHALHAAATAVEMRRELRRAARSRRRSDVFACRCRSASTRVTSTSSSSACDRELVVLGPDASHAICCEDAAEAGQIVVSDIAAAYLRRSPVTVRDDGRLLLRWRTAAIDPCGSSPPERRALAATRLLVPRIPAVCSSVADQTRAPDRDDRVREVLGHRRAARPRRTGRPGPPCSTTRCGSRTCVRAGGRRPAVRRRRRRRRQVFCSSGVPVTSEDDEGRMLRALHGSSAPTCRFRLQVGVNRGHVFVAEIGSPGRAVYSAMGDTTNTAARIAATAPPGRLYAHRAVLERARIRYEAEAVGPFAVQGQARAAQSCTTSVGRSAHVRIPTSTVCPCSAATTRWSCARRRSTECARGAAGWSPSVVRPGWARPGWRVRR